MMWLLALALADDLTVERARVQLEAERPAHVRSTEDIDGWAEACPGGDVLLTPR